MTRGKTTFLSVIVTALLIPWAIGSIRYGYDPLESQSAFYCIADGGTTYSERFTEQRFRSVAPGMSREEVRDLLGEPLVLPWWQGPNPNPREWWVALPRQAGSNAHLRCVEFDPDHRVTQLIARPYVD